MSDGRHAICNDRAGYAAMTLMVGETVSRLTATAHLGMKTWRILVSGFHFDFHGHLTRWSCFQGHTGSWPERGQGDDKNDNDDRQSIHGLFLAHDPNEVVKGLAILCDKLTHTAVQMTSNQVRIPAAACSSI